MKFILSEKVIDGKLLVNIIDFELKNKKLEDKTKKIDLTSNYYKGKEVSEENILEIKNKAFSIQFIGNKCVDFALKNKIVEKFSEINGNKYAFVLRF